VLEELELPLTDLSFKRPRGRPPGITDEALCSKRNRLLVAIERSWFRLRPGFSRLRTPDDVPALLRPLRDEDEEIAAIFVRRIGQQIVKTGAGKSLDRISAATRKRISELKRTIPNTADANAKRRERLDRMAQVLRMQMAEEQRVRALREQATMKEAFERDKIQLHKMRQEQAARETVLARIEVVQFVRSERYRLNPVRVANALAGLPSIGWRQSAKRCRKFPTPNGPSTLGMYKAMCRAIAACSQKADLLKHVEEWVRATPPSKCAEVRFLREKWYYLKRAIQSITAKGLEPGEDRAQAIIEEFLGRLSDRSPVDRLFENEEQITRKRPKIEI
jgi:hypothetical protein